MFKEDTQNELMGFISRMDESEQKGLLDALKKRDLLKRAAALDKNQKAFNKGRKKMSGDEIVEIVRSIRRANARKRA
jgi:hypothetical protein